jgi:hypothetical protein
MRSKLSIRELSMLGIALTLSALVLGGCGPATVEPAVSPTVEDETSTIAADPALADAMTEAEAREIAANSECGEAGPLLENAFYNDSTATWWIDLDVEQEGCAPACVVHVKTGQAEINWRCTGAIAPKDVTEEPEEPRVLVPPTETPAPLPTEPPAPIGEPIACWYGRVESTPEGGQFDDYLILPPEEARRAVGIEGADEAIEGEILALRDSGTYAHLWGALNCDVPDYGGCQLLVTRLRPDRPGGPFFDPDPVEGWEGTLFSTPEGAQFDDYFVLAGSIPVRYGIVDNLDGTIAAQLKSLRDTGAVIRVWGRVMCPIIDFAGTQILVDRLEVVTEPRPAEEEYEGWQTYTNARFGYMLRYPGDCTVMGANLDNEVQFAGPLVDNEHWPVLTVSHYDSDFYHPPAGTDVYQWVTDFVMSYDEIETVEIAGLPAVHLATEATPQSYAYDEYYFIRGDQLFRIMLLHTGGKQDWDFYAKFLQGFTFP